jgi:glycolate oxidase
MGRELKQPDVSDITALQAICGVNAVLTTPEQCEQAGRDYTEDLVFMPAAVVVPSTAEQVAAILGYCNQHSIPVTARGAGTGLSGGALPVRGGVVLASSGLNRIISIDKENFQACVEPGVINEVFRNAVEAEGLYYPPDPASRGSCFLGGNIAHSSGGPRAVKYGTTRDYVLNLQVALPSGELIWTGANTVKNSTGYNLTQLMVGSEGTLGFITKIVFRLIALPSQRLLLLSPFADPIAACRAVNQILLSGIVPAALELMERSGVEMSMRATRTSFPLAAGADTFLMIELDGDDQSLLQTQAEQILPVLEQAGAIDVMMADTAALAEQWWKVRRSIGEAVKSESIYKEEDTVVPRAALPDLMAAVKRIGEAYGFRSVCYGHAGDGNLHVNILRDQLSDQEWNQEVPKAIRELFGVCKDLGGTISGEHGIGLVQAPYLDVVFQPVHFQLMRGIKQVFDPNGILNPGKWVEKAG